MQDSDKSKEQLIEELAYRSYGIQKFDVLPLEKVEKNCQGDTYRPLVCKREQLWMNRLIT